MNARRIVATDRAPRAVGPYSQAVWAGPLLFVSGQIPLDPGSGQITGTGIEEQARQVLENLKAVVEAAGLDLGRVVKCTCFLKDLEHFSAFNAVYGRYFPDSPPTRECVQVARLPRDVLVEVSAICSAPQP